MLSIVDDEIRKKYSELSLLQKELYQERVAIMFYDGGLSYPESEKQALEDVLKY